AGAQMLRPANRGDHLRKPRYQGFVPRSLVAALWLRLFLGQRNHAKRAGTPSENWRIEPRALNGAGLHPRYFGRATANVDDHRVLGARFEQTGAAEHGETRLLLGRDHIELESKVFLDALQEHFAV